MMPDLASRLLGRLSVGKKLLLIYLLDLTAVIFVSGILINEKYIAIDFARKELVGLSYMAVIRDSLATIARTGFERSPTAGEMQGHVERLRFAEELHGATLQTGELNENFVSAIAELTRSAQLSGISDIAATSGEANAAASLALVKGRDLLTRIGNQSNLILDPDLDSYYAMSLVLLRFPELLEVLSDTAEKVRVPLAEGERLSGEQRSLFLILEGRLDATVRGIESDYGEAFSSGKPALRQALEPSRVALLTAVETFRTTARNLVEGLNSAPDRALLDASQRAALGSLHQAWREADTALEGLLETRVSGLFARMWLHLGTALFLLAIILTIVYFVARQIALPLRRLAHVAERVRQTGDHGLRAQWTSSDEIGRLFAAFNEMLAQLDRERMVQQELAASASASEAQRELVEAIPIALVVTSIPRHTVLHANRPALSWLNGRTEDPWQSGLEGRVRSRFFQRLADSEAVDEFEVRWQGSTEPAWAVLSARRLNYQGQDAVLTTFTPINQIKYMEARLELWSKVFEASSESIMIMDAEHRILTVNRAFRRSTLYEFHEVTGQTPDFLLGERQSASFFQDLWRSLGGRGSWQGEIWTRRRTGDEFPAWLVINVVHDEHGEVSHYIAISLDISDRKQSEERIRFLAHHDPLTDLPNRSLCLERLAMSVQQARRTGRKVAVLFIDLDRFKSINDSLGHHVGDGLLRSVALRLIEAVRLGDTVSRLGGDEFVVVLNGVVDNAEVTHIVESRLIPLVRGMHMVEGTQIHVSCSVGIAIYPDDGDDIDALMRNADVAMYQAKAHGRDKAHYFTADLNLRAQERATVETALRYALERKELSLYYQPRVDARSGVLLGVESLLRWHHPELGNISPERFVPIAEECGLIVPIGAWVINEACRQHALWCAEGLGSLFISINLSAVQLRSEGLVETLGAAMAGHGVPPGILELELTESLLMASADTTLVHLQALKDLGVALSIDDFGTGYSSLSYLNRFPIDKLKIDRSFVHGMRDDPTAIVITKAIIGLGHTLGLRVVAEGVENAEEVHVLRAARCDELQGFYFARPMPVAQFSIWFAARQLEAPAPLESVGLPDRRAVRR